MPRNSFLIEDILNNEKNTSEDFVPLKKRSFNNENHEEALFKNKQSPSQSPGSTISTTSSSSSDDNGSFFLNQNMKNFSALVNLNGFLNNMNNEQTQSEHGGNEFFLISSILQQFQQLNPDLLQQQSLLSQYYSRLFNGLNQQQQQQQQNQQSENDFQNSSKKFKSFSSSSSSSLSSSPSLNQQLPNLDEAKFRHQSNKIKKENAVGNLKSTKQCETSEASGENVSPLDALLQLANNTFVSRNGVLVPNDESDLVKKNRNGNDLDLNRSFESLNAASSTTTPTTTTPPTIIKSPILLATGVSTKRKRKNRTAFTANQIFELERRFSNQRYLSPHDRDLIAHELSLSTAQVITWFQNRRAKQKRDIEELKNDVNAAKSLKVIDADIDVDKVIRTDSFKYQYEGSKSSKLSSSQSDRNSLNEYENDEEEVDVEDENDGLSVDESKSSNVSL